MSPLTRAPSLALAGLVVACTAGPSTPPTTPEPGASAPVARAIASEPNDGEQEGGGGVPDPQRATPPGTDEAKPRESAPPESAASAKGPARLPPDTTVLHVGDSFAGALGHDLNRQLAEHGIKGVLEYEKSTYIPTWASNRELPEHLRRHRPDLVLITLGANELQIPDPNARAETVRRLVARLGNVPCVWIGIPLWEGAKPALMEVIRANVAPCLFLDSTELWPDMPRAKDKIHPSTTARIEWARRVVSWLGEHQDPAVTDRWHWR